MTLDEAIKHEEEVVQEYQYEYQECITVHDMEKAMNCVKYGEEHRQLAEWLKDYRRLLEQQPCDDCVSRQAVLDLCDMNTKYKIPYEYAVRYL